VSTKDTKSTKTYIYSTKTGIIHTAFATLLLIFLILFVHFVRFVDDWFF